MKYKEEAGAADLDDLEAGLPPGAHGDEGRAGLAVVQVTSQPVHTHLLRPGKYLEGSRNLEDNISWSLVIGQSHGQIQLLLKRS